MYICRKSFTARKTKEFQLDCFHRFNNLRTKWLNCHNKHFTVHKDSGEQNMFEECELVYKSFNFSKD